MRRRLFIILATVLALAVAAPGASGLQRSRLQSLSGVDKARAAGIELAPGAAAVMAAAPPGTCLNDPTLPSCPDVDRVAAPVTSSGAVTAFGPGITPANVARASRALAAKGATKAAAIDQCWVRASAPYYTTGIAHGHAANECQPTVSSHEVFATLEKRYNNVWSVMEVAHGGPAVPALKRTIYAYADYFCVKKAKRAYKNTATGYSILQGKMYSGVNVNDGTLNSCA